MHAGQDHCRVINGEHWGWDHRGHGHHHHHGGRGHHDH
jgi:hypothetical protein